MLNAGMVNAQSACLEHAYLCESFLVLGRFLHFKNPVKYKRIFEINQSKARHRPAATVLLPFNLSFQWDTP